MIMYIYALKHHSHFCEDGWTGQGQKQEEMETEIVWAKYDGG